MAIAAQQSQEVSHLRPRLPLPRLDQPLQAPAATASKQSQEAYHLRPRSRPPLPRLDRPLQAPAATAAQRSQEVSRLLLAWTGSLESRKQLEEADALRLRVTLNFRPAHGLRAPWRKAWAAPRRLGDASAGQPPSDSPWRLHSASCTRHGRGAICIFARPDAVRRSAAQASPRSGALRPKGHKLRHATSIDPSSTSWCRRVAATRAVGDVP